MKAVNEYLIQPNADLSGANLSEGNLSGADLYRANLSGANLSEGNLSGADLYRANLSGANLSGADLSGADLSGVDLSGANLDEADLSKANLSKANLSGANLSRADLSGVDLSGANLGKTIGIGTKKGEVEFANQLLKKLEDSLNNLEMSAWHICDTTHCLAGWAFPNLVYPGQRASLAYPTLAQYFYSSNEKAMGALKRVASGGESVFN